MALVCVCPTLRKCKPFVVLLHVYLRHVKRSMADGFRSQRSLLQAPRLLQMLSQTPTAGCEASESAVVELRCLRADSCAAASADRAGLTKEFVEHSDRFGELGSHGGIRL